MMKLIYIVIGILIGILPSLLLRNNIQFYETRKKTLNLKEFFNGDIEGWGGIFDYKGRQIRAFYVAIQAKWEGNEGVLNETFTFDDGEVTTRQWTITFKDEQLFIGKAGDIVGAEGVQTGNAVNLTYQLIIPYGSRNLTLSMNDWMYQIVDDKTVLNRTVMRKFGFKVGELALVMRKK